MARIWPTELAAHAGQRVELAGVAAPLSLGGARRNSDDPLRRRVAADRGRDGRTDRGRRAGSCTRTRALAGRVGSANVPSAGWRAWPALQTSVGPHSFRATSTAWIRSSQALWRPLALPR